MLSHTKFACLFMCYLCFKNVGVPQKCFLMRMKFSIPERYGMRITCHHKRNHHQLCCNKAPTKAGSRRKQLDQIRRNHWQQPPRSKSSVPFLYLRWQSTRFRDACHAFVSDAHRFPSAGPTCGCTRFGSLFGWCGTSESTGWLSARPEAYIYSYYIGTCFRRMRLTEFHEIVYQCPIDSIDSAKFEKEEYVRRMTSASAQTLLSLVVFNQRNLRFFNQQNNREKKIHIVYIIIILSSNSYMVLNYY